jgi:hypothetical protein
MGPELEKKERVACTEELEAKKAGLDEESSSEPIVLSNDVFAVVIVDEYGPPEDEQKYCCYCSGTGYVEELRQHCPECLGSGLKDWGWQGA